MARDMGLLPKGPVGPPSDWRSFRRGLALHECGHAVAGVLTGREVVEVVAQDRLGYFCEMKDVEAAMKPDEDWRYSFLAALGPKGLVREIVSVFAGPAAELRHDATHVLLGMARDQLVADDMAAFAGTAGIGRPSDLIREGWAEACKMMLDRAVWASVVEAANELEAAGRIPGHRISAIVEARLPDGWAWSRPFAQASSPATEQSRS